MSICVCDGLVECQPMDLGIQILILIKFHVYLCVYGVLVECQPADLGIQIPILMKFHVY